MHSRSLTVMSNKQKKYRDEREEKKIAVKQTSTHLKTPSAKQELVFPTVKLARGIKIESIIPMSVLPYPVTITKPILYISKYPEFEDFEEDEEENQEDV